MTRKELFEKYLEIRLSLSKDDKAERAKKASVLLQESNAYRQSRTIAVYQPIRGEFDLSDFIQKARKDGKRILLPRVLPQHHMVFLPWEEETRLISSKYGIPEPEYNEREIVKNIDFMIVPCVAVYKKYRLGYGGNYYNNYLSKNKVGYYLGLVPEECQCSEDFHDSCDIPMDDILAI